MSTGQRESVAFLPNYRKQSRELFRGLFRMLFTGYFEDMDSQRSMTWPSGVLPSRYEFYSGFWLCFHDSLRNTGSPVGPIRELGADTGRKNAVFTPICAPTWAFIPRFSSKSMSQNSVGSCMSTWRPNRGWNDCAFSWVGVRRGTGLSLYCGVTAFGIDIAVRYLAAESSVSRGHVESCGGAV